MFVRFVLIAVLAFSVTVLNSNPLQSNTEKEQRWTEKREKRKPDIYFPHNVHLEALKKEGIVSQKAVSVKILAGKAPGVALTVSVPCSESAKTIIEKAGGTLA